MPFRYKIKNQELKKQVDKIVLGQHFVYSDDNKSLKIFRYRSNSVSEIELSTKVGKFVSFTDFT